jgi:hypothetical protein
VAVRLYTIFPHYLTNGTISEKKVIEYKMCILIFCKILSETCIILRRSDRDTMKMYIGPRVKYPLFLSDFYEALNIPTDFQKNSQMSNFMKIRPVGAELYHADGLTDGRTDRRTDIKKLIVAFRNFAKRSCFENAPNEWHIETKSIANGLMELSLSGLAHFNTQEGHIIRYTNRKVGGGKN